MRGQLRNMCIGVQCGHWFCKECISDALAMNKHCPLCRTPAAPSQLKEAVYPAAEAEPEPEVEASTSRGRGLDQVEMNSKVEVSCCASSVGNREKTN